MTDGWVDRGRIVCPWHGSRFDVESGEVLRGPAAAPLPCYQTRISDGTIELRGNGNGQPVVRTAKGRVK
jgi:nitrite reductase/ring-hydroxylating ferredoxin subunit